MSSKKFNFRNLQAPTPAKWVKIGLSLLAVSAFVSASAFGNGKDIIGYIALAFGVLGTFLSNFFKTSVDD